MPDVHCLDRLVGAIYDGLGGADPWVPGLEQLRIALAANSLALRMSRKGARPSEVVHAAGPSVSADTVRQWEEKVLFDASPAMPALDEMLLIDWTALPQTEVVQLTRGSDVSMTASYCYAVMDNTSFALNASRGGTEPAFSERDLDLLRMAGGHFARALRLRQEMTRREVVANFQSEAMERMAVGGILIGPGGSVTALNAIAGRMIEEKDGLQMIGGRLHASDQQVDRNLQATIRSALATEGKPRSVALALPRNSSRRDLGLVVSPRRSSSPITGQVEASALLFVRDGEMATKFDADMLQQLFSFTRAEANLAIGLAQGRSFEDIESELNIRHNTARAHLRSIFVKTDVNRQAKLVSLLANSLASFGTPNEFLPAARCVRH